MTARFRHAAFLLSLLLLFPHGVWATHLNGGELSYVYLGNSRYEITARLYYDCLHGDPQAITQDNPLRLAVFRADGSQVENTRVDLTQRIQLPYTPVVSACLQDTSRFCQSVAIFKTVLTLPPVTGGYRIVNERCCMRDEVVNVAAPLSNGFRLEAVIPEAATLLNSSAVFQKLPLARACLNRSFDFDFSASDPDGDSLSYAWAIAQAGGDPGNPIPETFNATGRSLTYLNGFSHETPFGPDGMATLDAQSGLVRGRIYRTGAYVLAVRVTEWRAGQALASGVRTYILEAGDCNQLAAAGVVRDSLVALTGLPDASIVRCNGERRVAFRNASTGAAAYRWDFGVPNRTNDTSSEASPAFTYPAAGRYDVTLVAYARNCSDTVRTQVVLSDDPQPAPRFTTASTLRCPDTRVELADATPGLLSGTVLHWRLDEGRFLSADTGTRVACIWPRSGEKAVLQWAVTPSGCLGAATQTVTIADGAIQTSPDTTLLTGTPIELQASRGSGFSWVGLQNAYFTDGQQLSSGPEAFPATNAPNGRYMYVARGTGENGCPDTDTVTITVTSRGYVFVPTAFSPNGDGNNDVLLPFTAGSNLREFSIYSRAGQRVFQTNAYGQGWDGGFRGSPAPAGTYYWFIRSVDEGGQELIKSGDVTLLR